MSSKLVYKRAKSKAMHGFGLLLTLSYLHEQVPVQVAMLHVIRPVKACWHWHWPGLI